VKVTRVAYSRNLNAGKFEQLTEQARRLGVIRSKVLREYGSINGAGVKDRAIRDRWMADGTASTFTVLANAWKETVRDAVADITANREAAKAKVRKAINRRTHDPAERKRLFTELKSDGWVSDPWLSRQMRQHTQRGRNRTHNQIVVRSDQHRTFTLADDGNVWLAVPGVQRRQVVRIPLNTTVAPTGTLRLILRGDRVEVRYQVDAAELASSQQPCGNREIGVDKGYSEVLTDSDGHHHGPELGELLTSESDHRKAKNARRGKLRSIAEKATERGDHAKADRIRDNNLGVIKRQRRSARWQCRVRDLTFKAAHAVVDKSGLVVAEDLTKTFTGRKRLGKNTNRRLAAWTKGGTAEALANVSDRRGSAVRPVNAALHVTSHPRHQLLRETGRGPASLHSVRGRVAGRPRRSDQHPEARRRSRHRPVHPAQAGQTDPAGTRSHRSRLPDQDSNTSNTCRCGERNIRNRSTLIKE
jgi:hypothetical protein